MTAADVIRRQHHLLLLDVARCRYLDEWKPARRRELEVQGTGDACGAGGAEARREGVFTFRVSNSKSSTQQSHLILGLLNKVLIVLMWI